MPERIPCRKCGHVHPEEHECVWVLQGVIKQLLLRVGEVAECRGCKASIFWVKHLNGKRVPYTADGINHFATCPNAAQWRRPYEPVKKSSPQEEPITPD